MDNFRLDITSKGDIEPALNLIFRGKVLRHYKATPDRLLLAWTKPQGEGWLVPVWPMPDYDAVNLVTGWLKNVAQYPPQPDHDGDNYKGWRLYNEAWGHVDGDYAIFAAIEPIWAMSGK